MVAPLGLIGMKLAGAAIGGLAQALGGGENAAPTPRADRARRTATEFETVFLEQTLGQMFKESGEGGPLGDNGTNGVHRSMLVDQYARQITRSGGVGIADAVYRQMLALQEASR